MATKRQSGFLSWRDLLVMAVGSWSGAALAVLVVHGDQFYGWTTLVLAVIALVVLLVKDERGW